MPQAVGVGLSAVGAVAAELKPSPPVVVDTSGHVAFVRSDGRAGVVTFSVDSKTAALLAQVAVASERVCGGPVGVLPAGDRRLLFACHDGGLWMHGE